MMAPEDGARDVWHLDVALAAGRPALRSKGSAAETAAAPAGVSIDVETVEEVVEREPSHLALRNEAAGQPHVEPKENEPDQSSEREQTDLGADPRPEDVRVADALVPDGIGPETHADGEEEAHKDEDHYQRDPEDHPATADVDLRQLAIRTHRPRPARASVSATAEYALVLVAPIGAIVGTRSV